MNTFDAIVIGSGMSGGWAAKELCEKGLQTLVLERGREVKHIIDYPTMDKDPWDFPHRGKLSPKEEEKQHKQVRTGFLGQANKHFFVDDEENPYEEEAGSRFDWIRGYQTGGRSLIWGRQCYRWSDLDFTANAREGIGIDWPIRYKDIAPWYDHVEKFIGISGEKLGLSHLPDGQFQKPMPLNCLESHVKEKIEATFEHRNLTIGRVANLTEPLNGRGPCQYRNRCNRGCPYTAYFSSNGVTLPAAMITGNMTIRNDTIVHSIIYDDKKGKATGVRVINQETMESTEYFAKIIFCCASAIGSTAILMNSISDRFPNGLGNDCEELGHNLMDHHYFVGAGGSYDGFEDQYYKGRRPNGIYIPKFRNINEETSTSAFLRGYGYQGSAGRGNWGRGTNSAEFGKEFKDGLTKAGGWGMTINGFGEVLPYHENRMYLHPDKEDKWGLPLVTFACNFKENELEMRKQMKIDAAEMLEAGGLKNIFTFDKIGGIGKGIHEMGSARMGNDPKTAVLNKYNQVHGAENVYVTDGACMTSSACVNPSLTYMALTARAVDHAITELNKQNL